MDEHTGLSISAHPDPVQPRGTIVQEQHSVTGQEILVGIRTERDVEIARW
jgi:hypothetical protein